jgi:hypothetical protein
VVEVVCRCYEHAFGKSAFFAQRTPAQDLLNMIELTPSQIAALKLARDGDLYPQPANKWTHENATVTYAKTDRWKERPQKVKSVTAKTLGELKEPGFLERRHLDDDVSKDVYGITMAGKMWLLKNK